MDARSQSDPEALISQLMAATAAARRVLSIWDEGHHRSVRIGFEELGAAFEEIMRARVTVARIPRDPPAEVSQIFAQYQSALEQLKPHLPRFEGWLLAERARLENRQSHASAASNWAETQAKTR
jgi:hypothetical protein